MAVVANPSGTIMTDAKLGPPNLHWGSIPGLPALGALGVRMYTYNGHGQWVDATGGKWVG